MQDKLNIAVFVDYDNIEIGLKSTLRRDFDVSLALDALKEPFTHTHVNAFAIVSGDSDFIPLVNKLKEYGKTVFVVGGKAFTSTILQQNCHEFISFESLLSDSPERPMQEPRLLPQQQQGPRRDRQDRGDRPDRGDRGDRRVRPAPLELAQSLP